jgi:pheromone shutdown protein TraB
MNDIRLHDLIAAVFLAGGIWLAVSAAFGGAWFTSMTWFLSGIAMTCLWLFAADVVDVPRVAKRSGHGTLQADAD